MNDVPHLTGVNIAGAEFNGRKVPGVANQDYFYPAKATIDYFAAKGMSSIRVPFLWERMQPQLNATLDAAELKRLEDVVRYANGKGLYVILDVHNYAYYRQKVIGSDETPVGALSDLWAKLAPLFKDNGKVGFGLMNEPKGLPTETWLAAANAAIAEIRRAGASNLVLSRATDGPARIAGSAAVTERQMQMSCSVSSILPTTMFMRFTSIWTRIIPARIPSAGTKLLA
jgi:endoglucanase